MLSNRVNGALTKEQARQKQLANYQNDAKKYVEKKKLKEKEKLAEKCKKYSHLLEGEILPNTGIDLVTVRHQQQIRYEEDGVYNYIRELERENERMRREERKREEKIMQKSAQVDTGFRLGADQSPVQNPRKTDGRPFEENSLNSQTLQSPISDHAVSGGDPTDSQRKEEEFRREMRLVREKMQALYNERSKKDN